MTKQEYRNVHSWVVDNFGRANKCVICGRTKEIEGKQRTFCWMNKSGKYLRQRKDWKMSCYSCHKKSDYKNKGFIPWNKGKKNVQVGYWKNKKLTFTVWNKGKKLPKWYRKKLSIARRLHLKKEGIIK